MSQISSKQQELVGVMTQVNMLNESIQEKEADIQATQTQLEEAQAERDKQYEDMKKRIQYLYENGGSTSWARLCWNPAVLRTCFPRWRQARKYTIMIEKLFRN